MKNIKMTKTMYEKGTGHKTTRCKRGITRRHEMKREEITRNKKNKIVR